MNVLHVTLGFYSPYLNKALESFSSVYKVMVSLSLQTRYTTLQLSSGLPYLRIDRACFKVLTLGPALLPPLEDFLNSYFMIVSSITCDSAAIFVTFLNLHHDYKPTFHLPLWLSILVWSCRFLHTEICLCCWSSFSRQGTNMAAICFMLQYISIHIQ